MKENTIKDLMSILFAFEHEHYLLFEIERLDLDKLAPKYQRFQWYLYPKKSRRLIPLEFQSMKDESHLQQRVFKQGTLSFNQTEGKLSISQNYLDGCDANIKLERSSHFTEIYQILKKSLHL